MLAVRSDTADTLETALLVPRCPRIAVAFYDQQIGHTARLRLHFGLSGLEDDVGLEHGDVFQLRGVHHRGDVGYNQSVERCGRHFERCCSVGCAAGLCASMDAFYAR